MYWVPVEWTSAQGGVDGGGRQPRRREARRLVQGAPGALSRATGTEEAPSISRSSEKETSIAPKTSYQGRKENKDLSWLRIPGSTGNVQEKEMFGVSSSQIPGFSLNPVYDLSFAHLTPGVNAANEAPSWRR